MEYYSAGLMFVGLLMALIGFTRKVDDEIVSVMLFVLGVLIFGIGMFFAGEIGK